MPPKLLKPLVPDFLEEDVVEYTKLDDVDSVDNFIERSKDLDAYLALKDEVHGNPLLVIAAEEASVQCADRLIECGANVNQLGAKGMTPLLWCCTIGYPDHVRIFNRLLDEAELDCRIVSDNYETAFSTCVKFNRFDMADELLKRGRGVDVNFQGRNGNTCLIKAAFSSKLDELEYLMDNGADLNIMNMN